MKTTQSATFLKAPNESSRAVLSISYVFVQACIVGKEVTLCGASFIQDINKYIVPLMELCVDGGYGEK